MVNVELKIDYDKISQELKVRPEILKRLILSFSQALADRMVKLEEALKNNDTAQMRAILHEIKGTGGNLRLTTITTAENDMHVAVKAGEEKAKLENYFKVLKQRVSELGQYLSKAAP
ncbi:MAG: hypothetical protein A2Z88_01150 [Omnitrophica WOR_2 bacterium GWA2_47_8]|nr:MAG: hypothetical protein A2Z88_01150 [Omnitrophica WOR_2 bacterium GWA2_47_8]